MLGYAYYRVAGEAYALVSIGLVSFAAVAQFAPAMLGGMYWKRRHARRRARRAARSASRCGPTRCCCRRSPSRAGCRSSFIEQGLFGIALLKPLALFGLAGLDDISHALFWSMLANVGGYVAVSLLGRPARPRACAGAAVRRRVQGRRPQRRASWRGSASVQELRALVGRFLGPQRAEEAFARLCRGGVASQRPTLDARRRADALRRDPAGRRDRRRVGARDGRARW